MSSSMKGADIQVNISPSPSHSDPHQNHSGTPPKSQAETTPSLVQTTPQISRGFHLHFCRGIQNDLKRRLPFYWSDWKDAWNYRVIPASIYMFFANILPALAFSLEMFDRTHQSYGVNEVLLAAVLGSTIFSLFAAQPLAILAVTGPITVFNYTIYDIVTPRGTPYLAFMCWVGIWSLLMQWTLATTNACNGLTYVTRFSCDVFSFFVAVVYLEKGIQFLVRQWSAAGATSAYLSIVTALLVLMSGWVCSEVGRSSLFHRYVRKFIEDYGTPLTIVFFAGFVHIGYMRNVNLTTLPTGKAFSPTSDRDWLVRFWDISVGDVFLAIPFAMLLTALFYFDHNVSSLIAQGTEFPLRKPAGFHWDFLLLGITTLVAGLLGIPFPYAHIPQSPFHTAALCVTRNIPGKPSRDGDKPKTVRVIDHVVEQRLSNLAQGLITLVTMTGPILTALNLIPQGVLAGLLFLMGVQALQSNGVTRKLIFLAQDQKLRSPSNPFNRVQRRRAIWGFVILEVVGFACILAATQTIAAVGVPVMILLLIPVRSFLLPMVFTPEELAILDEPTASPFTMESVGGITGFNFTVSHPEIGASGDSKIGSESGVIMRQEGSLRSTVPEDLEHGKVD